MMWHDLGSFKMEQIFGTLRNVKFWYKRNAIGCLPGLNYGIHHSKAVFGAVFLLALASF